MNVMLGPSPNGHGKVKRIVSCDGHAWYTNADNAADYIFNPTFMLYFFLCIVLYAALMEPSEAAAVPFLAQVVLWGGLITTSILGLVVGSTVSVMAYDRGLTKAIYAPAVLLPMILTNVIVAEFILSSLNEQYERAYGSFFENLIQNSIVIATFDIIHGRFVAPHHPKYLGPRKISDHGTAPSQTSRLHDSTDLQTAPRSVSEVAQTQPRASDQTEIALASATRPPSEVPEEKNAGTVVIARHTLDVAALVWIKSEDHYLSIQTKDKNFMLRAKLGAVVKQLGDQHGMQINRSVWISYASIRSVNARDKDMIELELEDDSIFRVSKARRLLFEQNYQRFKV